MPASPLRKIIRSIFPASTAPALNTGYSYLPMLTEGSPHQYDLAELCRKLDETYHHILNTGRSANAGSRQQALVNHFCRLLTVIGSLSRRQLGALGKAPDNADEIVALNRLSRRLRISALALVPNQPTTPAAFMQAYRFYVTCQAHINSTIRQPDTAPTSTPVAHLLGG